MDYTAQVGSDKTPIEASHSTRTEHKIILYIDGLKYGFRCDESLLDQLHVEEGGVIPYINGWGGIEK